MNNITAILRQLEEGRLSTEEAAEKIRAAAFTGRAKRPSRLKK